jgi:hypothetical protein
MFVLIVVVLVASGARVDGALAGDAARLGTSGAHELRIPVGARGTALSGSATADAAGVEALHWNPAGVIRTDGPEFLFSSMSYLVDARVHYLGMAAPVGGLGSVGVSLKAVAIGDIAVTTEEAGGETGETYAPTLSVVGVTLGRQISERLSLGLTANFINESIRNESASGVAFDVGLQYAIPSSGFRFGAVMKSFGPKMHYEGPDFGLLLDVPSDDPAAAERTVVTESAEFDLPSWFQVGATYDAYSDENGRLRVLSAFQSNTFAEDVVLLGAEYDWRGQLVARAGTNAAPNSEDAWGMTYGAGVRTMLGGTAVLIDYTRQNTSRYFDDQDLVSLTLRF